MTTRSKAFMIDGGAGRVIAAIPALLKYHKKHPDEDWIVVIGGWDSLLWGMPEFQSRVFSMDQKGLFDNEIKHRQVISPEPYRVWGYYNQQLSLAEAFDEIINETTDHSDLGIPKMVLNKGEEKTAANIIADCKQQQGNKKATIIIQPFGRSARLDRQDVIDDSTRSIEPQVYLKLGKKLAKDYNMIFFGERQFHLPKDDFSFKLEIDLRGWAALIEAADYFVGCDSLGQHMARCFGTPGTVIMGSTYAINTTYPDYFQIIENENVNKVYSPIRIGGFDSHLADRLNDRCGDFTDKQIEDMYNKIVKDISTKVK